MDERSTRTLYEQQWEERMSLPAAYMLPTSDAWPHVPNGRWCTFQITHVAELANCVSSSSSSSAHNNTTTKLTVPQDVRACTLSVSDAVKLETCQSNVWPTRFEYLHRDRTLIPSVAHVAASINGDVLQMLQKNHGYDDDDDDDDDESFLPVQLRTRCKKTQHCNETDVGVFVVSAPRLAARSQQYMLSVSPLRIATCCTSNIQNQPSSKAMLAERYRHMADVLCTSMLFVEPQQQQRQRRRSYQATTRAGSASSSFTNDDDDINNVFAPTCDGTFDVYRYVCAPTFGHVLQMTTERMSRWHAHYASAGPVKFAMDIDMNMVISTNPDVVAQSTNEMRFESTAFAEGVMQEFEHFLADSIVDVLCSEQYGGVDGLVRREDVHFVSGCRSIVTTTRSSPTLSGSSSDDDDDDDDGHDKNDGGMHTTLCVGEEPRYKYSMHVVVSPPFDDISPSRPLVLLRDGTHGLQVANAVMDDCIAKLEMFGVMLRAGDYSMWRKYVDMGIYTPNHALREIGSVKTAHPRAPMRVLRSQLSLAEQMARPEYWLTTRPRNASCVRFITTRETGQEMLTRQAHTHQHFEKGGGWTRLLDEASRRRRAMQKRQLSTCQDEDDDVQSASIKTFERYDANNNNNNTKNNEARGYRSLEDAIDAAIGIIEGQNDGPVAPRVHMLSSDDTSARINFNSNARFCAINHHTKHKRNTVYVIVYRRQDGQFCAKQKCFDPDCAYSAYDLF